MTAVHVLLLIGCAAAIYVACEFFVNAIEWLGVELGVATLAVGTVLAAIGTALPESVVTLVAVLSGNGRGGKEIGVGAALGGPLVLSTLAYAVVGVLLLVRHRRSRAAAEVATDPFADVDRPRLVLDQTWFLVIAGTAMVLGLVAFTGKQWLGLLFFAGYGFYVRRELSGDEPAHSADDLESLRLWRREGAPPRWAVVAQTLAALLVVVVASQLFVQQLEWAGPELGLPPAAVALLLAPIATELPEVLNAVIWARQGKTRLAMANIAGSMMVQATVPAGIGLLFTPWKFDAILLSASLATLAAVAYLRTLAAANRLRPAWVTGTAVFYGAFAIALAVELS
ncbi:MAG: sodium:calcium antiporter [Actinomycetes bacterium]